MSEPVPAWLAAWRAGQEPLAPAQPPRVPAPARFSPSAAGFSEPHPWPFDGCARREPVLDHDYHPPRVVRRVGWQRCMRCRQPFWSEDVVGQRLCAGPYGCRDHEDRFAQGEPGGSYTRYHD